MFSFWKKKPIKLCKNCKFYEPPSTKLYSGRDIFLYSRCGNLKTAYISDNFVDTYIRGEADLVFQFCESARKECGKEAKYFEPKEVNDANIHKC